MSRSSLKIMCHALGCKETLVLSGKGTCDKQYREEIKAKRWVVIKHKSRNDDHYCRYCRPV